MVYNFILNIFMVTAFFFLTEQFSAKSVTVQSPVWQRALLGIASGLLGLVVMGHPVLFQQAPFSFHYIPILLTGVFSGSVSVVMGSLALIIGRILVYGWNEFSIVMAVFMGIFAIMFSVMFYRVMTPWKNWIISTITSSLLIGTGMFIKLRSDGDFYISDKILLFLFFHYFISSGVYYLVSYIRRNKENYEKLRLQHRQMQKLQQEQACILQQVQENSMIIEQKNAELEGQRTILQRQNKAMQRQQKELQSSLKELGDIKFALDQSSILAITDHKGVITYVNDTFCQISKYKREELIGKTHKIINSSYHPSSFFADMWSTIRRGQVWKGEVQNRAKDGSRYWVDTTIVPFLDGNGKPYQYVAIRKDISDRKETERQLVEANRILQRLSSLDGLTGIHNRRTFNEELTRAWGAARDTKAPLSVVLFDVDHFKLYNDYYGHQEGDGCLQAVAKAFEDVLKKETYIGARYGGEEFVALLPDTGLEEAEKVAESVREAIEHLGIPHAMSPVKSVVTGSFGVASMVPNWEYGTDLLVARADRALYQAKQQGRNRVAVYSRRGGTEVALLPKER